MRISDRAKGIVFAFVISLVAWTVGLGIIAAILDRVQ